ncbi:MAG: hypothetical protein HF973_08820 [Chloroflexi bacterium]|nr:hypothetical protein [Chloroflexota bacterium]
MPTNDRRELWRGARMIAAEGYKAGVHRALALQDPTHKSLDPRIRRNCLPLSFRVKDGDASRVILGAGCALPCPIVARSGYAVYHGLVATRRRN